jgi:hypothetical protein
MKSQISISGQAVSRRRAANQVKPFDRQKTDSHTRRPGNVPRRYDDPVTVKRLGNTDHGAVLIAAIATLFTTRYPPGLFDLALGIDRWATACWFMWR